MEIELTVVITFTNDLDGKLGRDINSCIFRQIKILVLEQVIEVVRSS